MTGLRLVILSGGVSRRQSKQPAGALVSERHGDRRVSDRIELRSGVAQVFATQFQLWVNRHQRIQRRDGLIVHPVNDLEFTTGCAKSGG